MPELATTAVRRAATAASTVAMVAVMEIITITAMIMRRTMIMITMPTDGSKPTNLHQLL